jgi:hypothetical protein
MEGSVIDGEWNSQYGTGDLFIDDEWLEHVQDIVEFYRAHGTHQMGENDTETQQLASALARRLEAIIEDADDEGDA